MASLRIYLIRQRWQPRALASKPQFILADEPTGNLDSKTSIEILGLLEDIHKNGNTVIIVTHEEVR